MSFPKFLGGLAMIAYQPAMAYGMLSLAGYWAGNARGAGGAFYLALALGGPLTAWLMTFFAPPLALLCPASLAVLYFMLDSEERASGALREETDRIELEQASQRAAESPDDGAAHLTRAELLEKAGRRAEAWQAYLQAHRCSDYMVSAVQLETIKTRLAEAEQDAGAGGGEAAALRAETEEMGAWVERVLLALSLPVLFVLPYAAASLAAVMLFLLWFRGYTRRR